MVYQAPGAHQTGAYNDEHQLHDTPSSSVSTIFGHGNFQDLLMRRFSSITCHHVSEMDLRMKQKVHCCTINRMALSTAHLTNHIPAQQHLQLDPRQTTV